MAPPLINLCEACHQAHPPTNLPLIILPSGSDHFAQEITSSPTVSSYPGYPQICPTGSFPYQAIPGAPPGQVPPHPTLGLDADSPTPPLQYASAVIREHSARLAADTLDIDEATRVGVEVMTVTETMTPDRTPRSHHWTMDSP